MKKLKIAQIGPLSERVPPKKYGGTERVIHSLTEELVQRGHDVTLFSTGDSKTSAKLVSTYPRSLREDNIENAYGINLWKLLNAGKAYKMADQFDIIHDHNFFTLPIAQLSETPTVITMHTAFNPTNRRLFREFDKPFVVTISKDQSNHTSGMNIISTVYNGLSMEKYPFSSKIGKYLLVVGRITVDKGIHHAIDAALDLNLPLIIAAKIDPKDIEYFNFYIAPRLSDDRIRWIGEVDEKERNKLMKNALCLLHPVKWEEPFGLVMIESMACGTPVVAFNRGSIPEVISHGISGFVVSDLEEMIEGIMNVDKINRFKCRNYAINKFNTQRMADGYEAVYEKILKEKGGYFFDPKLSFKESRKIVNITN